MDCSVIVCTRNRHQQLEQLLCSMTAMAVPPSLTWELIVVDNGSTDDTPAVIESFKTNLPVRRLFQPKPGKSNAQNFGVPAAAGEYFIWIDDDVRVEPNWLVAYLAAFKRWPDAAVFSGKITPVLQPPTPEWFRDSMGDLHFLLATRDFGPEPIPLASKRGIMPFGANWAVRAAEQRQHPYDVALGVAPGRRRGGEETAVVEAILADNGSGWWVPEAEVKHIIPPSRQTTEYICYYYEGMGEADAFSHMRQQSSQFTIPLAASGKLPLAFCRLYVAHRLGLKSWVRCLASYAYHHGKFKQWIAALSHAAD
jgi:glycosyltransferase involved in cell wall biosynthesis